MEQQMEYEREIDLKNLLYYVLRRWKAIILVALVCMVALGAYKYVSLTKERSAILSGTEERESSAKQAEDAVNGLVDGSKLEGDVLLYYNQLVKIKQYNKDIASNEVSRDIYVELLEEKREELAEYEAIPTEEISREDLTLYVSQKNSVQSQIASYEKEITNIEYKIQTLKLDLEDAEESADLLLDAINEADEKSVVVATFSVKPAIKFAVIGLIGGGFVMVFALCLLYLFSGKLLDINMLKDAYGLRVLAVIPTKAARKGIDGWIGKLSGYVKQTKEQAYDVLYARLINLSGQLKGKTIVITGTADADYMRDIQSFLQEKESGAKFVVCENPMKQYNTILAFKEADEILLVETVEKSLLAEIQQELQYMGDVKKAPVGVAVIG